MSSPVTARQPCSLGVPGAARSLSSSPHVASAPSPSPSAPCFPPPLGLVSVSRRSPRARRLVRPSVRFCALLGSCQRSLCGPQSPLVRPSLPLLRPHPGRAAAPSFPCRQLCVPVATRPSPLGPRSAPLCTLGCENPTVSAELPSDPGIGAGPWRPSPHSAARGHRASRHLKCTRKRITAASGTLQRTQRHRRILFFFKMDRKVSGREVASLLSRFLQLTLGVK